MACSMAWQRKCATSHSTGLPRHGHRKFPCYIGRMRAFGLAAFLLLSASATAQSTGSRGEIHYRVTIDSITEGRAQVSMRAHGGRQLPAQIRSYAHLMNLGSQVSNASCDGLALAQESNAPGLTVPDDCSEVTWQSSLTAYDGIGHLPSDQQSWQFDNGQWMVFSTVSSLLRPIGDARERLFLCVEGEPCRETLLAAANQAPHFIVSGNVPAIEYRSHGFTLRYVGGDLESVARFIEPARHFEGIEYLREVLGPAKFEEKDESTVVWIAQSGDSRSLGAATGISTLLVNFVPDARRSAQRAIFMPFVGVLHEQFHQLSRSNAPVWVNESLAHFYAMRSALRALPDNRALRDFIAAELADLRPPSIGLLEVQRQVDSEGNFENYGQFYESGPKFWHAIDTLLVESSSGTRSIDDLLPQLLLGDWSGDRPLPSAAMELLEPQEIERLQEVFARYL